MLDKAKNVGAPYKYLANANVRWGSFDYSDIRETLFTPEEVEKFDLREGDVVMCEGGVPGRCAVWQSEVADMKFQKAVHRLRSSVLTPLLIQNFFAYAVNTDWFKAKFTGTTIKHLPREALISILIPISPIAEQKRIVAKIEELFAEVEKIATAKDGITRTAERINKKVLDFAIRGQLVPQDASDEPAAELLKRITEARQKATMGRSRAAGKNADSVIFRGADRSAYETRNGKTVCIDDEIPFEIPNSWAWCRLRDLGEFVGGHTPSLADKSNWENGSILWVTSKDMKQKYISDTGNKVSRKGAKELQILPSGSLLMVTRSGILRRTFPIAIAAKPLTINQDQRALRFHLQGIEEYVYCVLKGMESLILRDYRKTGTTVESIIWEKFIDLLIPIPPIAEQNRIVAKIEEVRGLVKLIPQT